MTAYLRPRDLDEAVAAIAANPTYAVLAGGTDLMVSAPHKPVPVGLIDLWRLPGTAGVSRTDAGLRVGAGTTWLEVTRDALILAEAPILAEAAREIGALQIQARGTLGGNVANSSPVGDSLPVLLALDASIELRSTRGTRHVPYREFCTGYRTTARAADELIVAAHLPTQAPGTVQRWRKVGTRRAQSISKTMAAACILFDGNTVRDARIGLGAVADRPIRATAVESAVRGLPRARAAEAASAALATMIAPITDVRSTSAYRLDVAQRIVARFFV